MGIMPAGMRHPRRQGGKRKIRGLRYLQRVKIRPQADAFSSGLPVNHRNNAVSAHMLLGLQAHPSQDLRDVDGSHLLLAAGLRMLMEPDAVLFHFSPMLLNPLSDIVHSFPFM